MKKKVSSFLCSLLTLTLLAGCARSPVIQAAAPSQAAAEASTGTLSIAAVADSANPYITNSTIVEQNSGLLFESFLQLTPDLDIEYRLAQSVETSGSTVTIQLRGSCRFADGTDITAGDAAASLLAAKASALYAERFSNLLNVEVAGTALLLTLAEPDSLFACLLDIPVMKADETASPFPTASGRYTYGSDHTTLVKNTRCAFPEAGPDVIALTEVSGYAEIVSGMALGTVNFYLADEGSDTASGSITSSESYYKTNDLIFLGVNGYASNPLCNTSEGRVLLSSLLSRKELAVKSYYARAYAATGALNSYYPCVRGRQVILAEQDDSALDSTMAALGYTMDEATGLYTSGRRAASVSLLSFSGNSYRSYCAQLIAQQLQNCGISVTLTETADFSEYLTFIQSRQFELYIGETKLYNNMDLSPFFTGDASYGTAAGEQLLASYQSFRANVGSAGDFEAAFAAEMPYIPLLWRGAAAVSSRKVSGVIPSLSDAFYSLADLTVTG